LFGGVCLSSQLPEGTGRRTVVPRTALGKNAKLYLKNDQNKREKKKKTVALLK
jgi:hypothetical protein